MRTIEKSSLGDILLVLRRNIVQAIKKEGLEHDLTFSQVEVLHFIGPTGKVKMSSIAEYLKITPPSATEIIKEMEKIGLVKRVSDEVDRRIVYIVFTDLAKKLFTSIAKRKELILQKMVTKLSKVDQISLERIIKILIKE
ncbi:MAG: MarR family transcriptional regulator [bacterium]